MKKIRYWILILLVILCPAIIYSQNFVSGVYSGFNLSDIHGQDIGGRWVSKPGPSEGLSFGYSFNKSLGVRTGIGFSTVYYENRQATYPVYYPDYLFSSISYRMIAPFYYPQNRSMEFTFLRVPLLFTVSIPSALQFNMSAGLFFSFVRNHNFNPTYFYSAGTDNIKKKDFGYLFASGISYPINSKMDVSLNFNYLTGRKKFLEYYNLRNGSAEITFGIDYKFIKNNGLNTNPQSGTDSLTQKISITYNAGVNYSWNKVDAGINKYSPYFGPSIGFTVNFPLGHGIYFISGVSLERKGYALRDSSTSFYLYLDKGFKMYDVDTKVITDYAVIPFLIRLPLGTSKRVFFDTGPWLGLKLNARTVGVAYSETHTGSVYQLTKNVVYDDIERLINNNDIGWLFSGGVSLPLPDNYLIDLTLQYSTGFKNIYNNNILSDMQLHSTEDQTFKNRTLSLHIGITFPQKKL